jgi:hypothetical protein
MGQIHFQKFGKSNYYKYIYNNSIFLNLYIIEIIA